MSMAARRLLGSSALETSRRIFPGASNGEFDLPRALDTVLAKGQGARVFCEAGREYLDFTMGWGSALVGHARPEVVEAVAAQAPLGSNFSWLSGVGVICRLARLDSREEHESHRFELERWMNTPRTGTSRRGARGSAIGSNA